MKSRIPRPLNILLVAEESAGARALRVIQASGHSLVAVLTSSGGGSNRSDVHSLAQRLGRPTWPPELVRDPAFAHVLRRERVDLLLNVHSLHVIAADVLSAPAIGSFNLHPGPLPSYAGLDAPSWAVYNAERQYASTLHWMTPEVDAGPIAYSASFPLDPAETAISVYAKCVRNGVPLLERLIQAAARSSGSEIPALEQDAHERRYFSRLPPHDRWLLWSLNASRLSALVRACDFGPYPSPWGHARTLVDEVEVEVLRATATAEPADVEPGTIGAALGGEARIAAADTWLRVEAVRVDGRKSDPASALPQGRRCRPVAE